METFICEKCRASMALADTICVSCGTPAPAGRAAQALKTRAEVAYENGDIQAALRQMARALESGLPLEEAPLAWRKLGLWQEKSGALSLAESSYLKAMSLDDSDDLAHQLYITCLGKQGHLDRAAAQYQARLDKNPEDATAKKHLSAIKVAFDIKAAPPPVVKIENNEGGMFGRAIRNILKPSPWKVLSLGLALIFSVAQLFLRPSAHDVSVLTSGDGIPPSALNVLDVLNDPWVVGVQAVATLWILIYMYRNR